MGNFLVGIQDFKLGGGALKKSCRAEGGVKIFGVKLRFRVKNHDFMQKNHIFFNYRGGARRVPPTLPPPGPPLVSHNEKHPQKVKFQSSFIFCKVVLTVYRRCTCIYIYMFLLVHVLTMKNKDHICQPWYMIHNMCMENIKSCFKTKQLVLQFSQRFTMPSRIKQKLKTFNKEISTRLHHHCYLILNTCWLVQANQFLMMNINFSINILL